VTWPAARIEEALDRAFSAPAYQWAPAGAVESWAERWSAAIRRWFEALDRANPLVFRIVIGVLVALLAAFALHGIWVLWRTTRLARAQAQADRDFAVVPLRPDEDAHAIAAAFAARGQYAAALRWRWHLLDRRLREADVLEGPPALTPHEVVLRSRLEPAAALRLRALVSELYAVVYAGRAMTDAEWQSWIERADAAWSAPRTEPHAA
jgi:hypothetical protein